MGVGWVYCFLSRREGAGEELVTGGGQIPFLNSLEYGSPFGVLCVGGAGFDGRVIAETLICFES